MFSDVNSKQRKLNYSTSPKSNPLKIVDILPLTFFKSSRFIFLKLFKETLVSISSYFAFLRITHKQIKYGEKLDIHHFFVVALQGI